MPDEVDKHIIISTAHGTHGEYYKVDKGIWRWVCYVHNVLVATGTADTYNHMSRDFSIASKRYGSTERR